MMLPLLTLILFVLGAGIFCTLSAMERRVYPLFWNGAVAEADIREVQSLLALVVDILPKAMMVIVFGSGLLIGIQLWTGALGNWAWPIGITYTVMIVLILRTLFPTIKAVKETDSLNGPIDAVRPITRDTIIVHHLGLVLTALMVPMFGAVVL